jgi:glyoxylate reductase
MKTVILSKRFNPEAVAALARGFRLVVAADHGWTLKQAVAANPDAAAIIPFLSDRVDRDLMEMAGGLKVIANFAVGYNNVDIAYAIDSGIYVTHTPDILTDATADLAMALILAVARRLIEADRFVRRGDFSGWDAGLFLGKDLARSTLGIIGMGRIGLATALRALNFGLKIVYYSRTQKPELEKKHGFTYLPFVELLRNSDFVSLHLPYSPDVHHLFNEDAFRVMKPDAVFINVSRGPLADERCLVGRLERKELFGAGLDVYEFEPEVTESLKKLENVVLLPHIGSATEQTRREMAMMTVWAVSQALNGERPRHLIPEWREYLKGSK